MIFDTGPLVAAANSRDADHTQYADLPLGTTDAIVMAMVESRKDLRVATLDLRHFSIVRPDGFDRFVLLPDEESGV